MKHFKEELQASCLQLPLHVGLWTQELDMFARIAIVSKIGMLHLIRDAAIDQGNLMNSSQPRAANAGDLAQVQDQVTRRVLIDFLRFVHDLHKILCVNAAAEAHDRDRLACLLHIDCDFHVLVLAAIF